MVVGVAAFRDVHDSLDGRIDVGLLGGGEVRPGKVGHVRSHDLGKRKQAPYDLLQSLLVEKVLHEK